MDVHFFGAWMEKCARVVHEQREHLTRLDAAIGDADHGTNLDRGFTAIRQALAESPPTAPGPLLALAGTTLIRKVGGASGPLYGSALRQMGKALGEAESVTLADLSAAMDIGLQAVRWLGSAEQGDKTMVDAFAPACAALRQAVAEGVKLPEALAMAAEAADQGAKDTVSMQARKGRASYLGPRSIGHQDPGATSTAMIFCALRDVSSA
ncbi:dihydroxyacetone kinase subunit DhaL [Thermopolyspora sp. NPDC052614]|uniref:dihydroxyacetone kinase subunit DhaL n=1 Tax=Thermopolyspora sp. NPDC052614 TaxID=3155682 RepID=UPI0034288473